MSGMIHTGSVVSGGRLQIPAAVRRQLALADGDSVRMEVVEGELRVRSTREVYKRIAKNLRKFIPADVSLVDELIAERRAEAAREALE